MMFNEFLADDASETKYCSGHDFKMSTCNVAAKGHCAFDDALRNPGWSECSHCAMTDTNDSFTVPCS